MMVSIIIPLYNASQYLCDCLDSVLKQTYKDVELILVDDCSQDSSGAICDEYASIDSRIHVFHQPINSGVSAARNKGIELAKGEFICFVDSDDWICEDYIQKLVELQDDDVDLVTVGMFDFVSEHDCKRVYNEHCHLTDLNEAAQLHKLVSSKRLTGPWGKLFKTSIIKDNNLRFTEGISFAEDKEFVARYISHCRSVIVSDYCGYFYRCDVEGSLSKRIHKERYETEYRVWEIWYDSIRERGARSKELDRWLAHELYYIISDSIILSKKFGYSIPKVKAEHRRFLRRNWKFIDDRNVLRKVCVVYGWKGLLTYLYRILH